MHGACKGKLQEAVSSTLGYPIGRGQLTLAVKAFNGLPENDLVNALAFIDGECKQLRI